MIVVSAMASTVKRLMVIIVVCGLLYDVVILVARSPAPFGSGRRGFTSREFVDAAGEMSRYVVYVPSRGRLDVRFGLLLFLNGYGENGVDGARQISNNFGEPVWECLRDCPLICVAPQCRTKWARNSQDMVTTIAIVDSVVKEYDVDRDRVYVTGVSAGGAGVWNIAAMYRGKFAAIVPVSGTCDLTRGVIADACVDRQLPIWNVYNEFDPAAGLTDNNVRLRERLLAAGLSPIVSVYAQDHHDSWNASYRNAAMFEWLCRQNRSENAKRVAGIRFRELLVDESGLSEWTSLGTGAWTVAERILECRGADASASNGLTLNAELADFEVHFDYRSASDTGCEIVLESVESGEETVWIRFESPAQGTGGVRHLPSGEWLGNVNPVAQVEWLDGRWNDLRISLRDGELQLLLNGAELLVIRDHRLIGTHRVKLCVPAGEVNDREWRYLRLWDPNGAKFVADNKTNKT